MKNTKVFGLFHTIMKKSYPASPLIAYVSRNSEAKTLPVSVRSSQDVTLGDIDFIFYTFWSNCMMRCHKSEFANMLFLALSLSNRKETTTAAPPAP